MRIERIQLAELATDLFKESGYAFFVSYQGMKVAKFEDLRKKVYGTGASCQVLKNSYIKLGLTQNDVKLPADFGLTGDTAIVFGGDDPVQVAKVLRDFTKEAPNVVVKGGVLDGTYLTSADAAAVADMPSKEQIYAEIVFAISNPASRLVRILTQAQGRVVTTLQSYVHQKENDA